MKQIFERWYLINLFFYHVKSLRICEICHWRRSSVFIVNLEHILHIVLVFPLLNLNKEMPPGLGPYQTSVMNLFIIFFGKWWSFLVNNYFRKLYFTFYFKHCSEKVRFTYKNNSKIGKKNDLWKAWEINSFMMEVPII